MKPHLSSPTIQKQASQYLSFVLGDEIFALEILNIKEIIEYGALTTVPMMPDFVRGVINLRGRVVPVIDLAARFQHGMTAISRRTSIVITELTESGTEETQLMGILVDAVNEVIDIANKEIETTPAFGAKIRADFIQGIAKKNARFIILLDLERVLSIQEMLMLSNTSQRNLTLTESENEG